MFDEGCGDDVRFVGEDGEAVSFGGEAFQHGGYAFVGDGALLPCVRVFAHEGLQEGVDGGREVLFVCRKGIGAEPPRSAADEGADVPGGMGGFSEGFKRAVQGEGDAGQGVDEGAVEVEDDVVHDPSVAESAFGCFQELYHAEEAGVGSVFGVGLEGGDGFAEVGGAFEEDFFVALFECFDVVFCEAPPSEADGVDGADSGRMAFDDGEGRDVLRDACNAADEGVFSDADELVDGGASGEDGVVADFDMTCDGGEAGEDDVVADDAVVADVGVDEEEVVAADDGFVSRAGGAVDVAVFAEGVVVSDDEPGGFSAVFEVLGAEADDGEGVEDVAFAEGGGAFQYDMAVEDASRAEGDVRADDAEGADLDVVCQFCGGMDDCRRMYVCHDSPSMPQQDGISRLK